MPLNPPAPLPFATDGELAALEDPNAPLAAWPPAYRQMCLAWHLRFRDKPRALALVAQLEHELQGAPAPAWLARLRLVRAEDRWLDGDTAAAQALVDEALQAFASLPDEAGLADAHWIAAQLALQRGESDEPALALAALACERAGDRHRSALVALKRVFSLAFSDAPAARRLLAQSDLEQASDPHPAVQAWLNAARACILVHEDDAAASTSIYVRAQLAAVATGQLRSAAVWASNIGVNFRNLNDLAATLEWQERALALARQLGSRVTEGLCLSQLGVALADLKRPEAAMAMLLEADAQLPEGSGAKALNCHGLGVTLMALRDWQAAIPWLETARSRCGQLGLSISGNSALLGLAQVHLELGHLPQARALCQQALTECQAQGLHRQNQAWAHQLLARLCGTGPDSGDGQTPPGQTALWHLQKALRIAQSIPNFVVEPDWLEALAAEHARHGDMAAAYRWALEAGQAHARIHGQEASGRATALQVRYETEHLRVEADFLRQLRESDARRAYTLAQANATLKQLGQMGRDITACADESAVYATLQQHIHQLLDASSLAVCVLGDDPHWLSLAHGMQNGVPIPPYRVAMSDPQHPVARCARERCEILIDAGGGTPSQMLAPLLAGPNLLGVLVLQSARPRAYGERELAIFRSLCAYSAVALANARALTTLQQARAELVEKNGELERVAVTDPLTGLYNRRQLDTVLAREMASAQRYSTVFSLIMLDIDHFKRINDAHGHLVGDRVLIAIGRLLSERKRATDTVGRWGGEEFLMICPHTTCAEAVVVADFLRQWIGQQDFAEVGGCTVSLGAASYHPGETLASLEARADAAMYAAKAGGRNRVVAQT